MPGLNGEFIPYPPLAQSNSHHKARGSSQRFLPDVPENLHRPNHEFMSDEELRQYVEKELSQVREEYGNLGHEEASKGGTRHVDFYKMMRDKFLMPNLCYLKVIGRLPEGIDLAAIGVELEIPDGIK